MKAVVICTAKRGVFFGYTNKSCRGIIDRGSVVLTNARIVTYWSAATKGVLGLAGIGPQPGSRVSPRVERLAVESVTAVMTCSDEAIKAWESGPWS